ncbi:MAG: ATP-dependent DNA helicase UvrD/PcrA [uncultured Thermomicrobiales bacterium]|uniref:DNA 3'-5' helicase n=1 Tax=uncultured Thermomicrobiales bacterium TaxID=1645740 RepID=A0A6J4U9K6_9BACT|nr:MAG: ATP-dependent DNA helicase UvrD/PcrA [uncultured Thermomicrobiales bacterium]
MVLTLTVTPTFMTQLLALPTRDSKNINAKVMNLCADPTPDGKQRKRLKHHRTSLFRARFGKYRVLYNFNHRVVQALCVDTRDSVYDDIDDYVPEALPEIDDLPEIDLTTIDQPTATRWLFAGKPDVAPAAEPSVLPVAASTPAPSIPADDDRLSRAIDAKLLAALRIPEEHHDALLGITTVTDLIAAAVPQQIADRLFDVTMSPDIDRLIAGPSLEVTNPDDLDRIVDGDIVELLLHLDPDQERLVGLAVNAGGPVMVKGGPGSGKTTIAVRRVERVLAALRAEGVTEPRILFTTYTNALVSTTRQLLARALGDDVKWVTVETADRFARRIVERADGAPNMTSGADVLRLLPKARQAAGHPSGEGTIGRMSDAYLEAEIMKVIVAREVPDLAAYGGIERTGRRVPLRREQRAAVWAVWAELEKGLRGQGKLSWEMMRRRAATLVREGHPTVPEPYDAILVDEVQDLDPTVIRLLTELCPARSRLFLTADANQSIYGGSFNWRAVHADLRFQGRSGNLTRTHRTTYEIVRAASRYLATDATAPLDEITTTGDDDIPADRIADQFPRRGPEPVIRTVATSEIPAALVAFIRERTAAERVGLGGVAVLVPTSSYGESMARDLTKLGIRAQYARGEELDLSAPSVKITTLHSAKGLEFPIVALVGLHIELPPSIQRLAEAEAAEEWQKRRRIVYVGMTRAMRSLLVLVPKEASPLTAGLVSTSMV